MHQRSYRKSYGHKAACALLALLAACAPAAVRAPPAAPASSPANVPVEPEIHALSPSSLFRLTAFVESEAGPLDAYHSPLADQGIWTVDMDGYFVLLSFEPDRLTWVDANAFDRWEAQVDASTSDRFLDRLLDGVTSGLLLSLGNELAAPVSVSWDHSYIEFPDGSLAGLLPDGQFIATSTVEPGESRLWAIALDHDRNVAFPVSGVVPGDEVTVVLSLQAGNDLETLVMVFTALSTWRYAM